MKIEKYAGIKHIVISDKIRDEDELYNVLEGKVFHGSYKSNTFYPVVINNYVIFAYKNSQNYIHFYMKNKRYRFDSKNKLKYVDMLVTTKEYKHLIKQVKTDNKKIFK